MKYAIKNHLLELNEKQVPFIKSPHGGASMTPRYLVIHYTAGSSASGAVTWFMDPRAKASAHLVIDRDGTATQMMNFNKVAWHAGESKWGGLRGLNQHAIGIELVNSGKLNRTSKGQWTNWANQAVDEDEVYVLTHKHEKTPAGWHTYTQAQFDTVFSIGLLLKNHYHLLDVIGHDDISKGRKVDPGPAFPMISVQSKIVGRSGEA